MENSLPLLIYIVLSAFELQEPSSAFYTTDNRPSLKQRLDKLDADVRAELKRQGFEGDRAAICSSVCATMFENLEVVATGIQNEKRE